MTLDLFDRWYPHIQHLPLALVGQDGMEDKELPWSCFDCFFIGGSTRWKLSHAALTLAIEAKQQGETPAHGEGQQQYAVTLCLRFEL